MKTRPLTLISIFLGLALVAGLIPWQSAAAESRFTGGVNIFSVLPKRICVGDTIRLEGGASITSMEDDAPGSLPWLPVTRVNIKARLGSISPQEIVQYNDGYYFTLTYKAVTPGPETLTLSVNDGVAYTQERFQVEEKCDYDAFLNTVMHFNMDLDGEVFESIAHVTGTGTMKRDRQDSQFYQGDGTWHLEEIMLSKPSGCVTYYSPPLIMQGPFELDGRLADEGDTVDVILSFLPPKGKSFHHGDSICVDQDGDVGYAWSDANRIDATKTSKIDAEFLTGGGSKTVELKGAGMDMIQSAGVLDYSATLTLIPR